MATESEKYNVSITITDDANREVYAIEARGVAIEEFSFAPGKSFSIKWPGATNEPLNFEEFQKRAAGGAVTGGPAEVTYNTAGRAYVDAYVEKALDPFADPEAEKKKAIK